MIRGAHTTTTTPQAPASGRSPLTSMVEHRAWLADLLTCPGCLDLPPPILLPAWLPWTCGECGLRKCLLDCLAVISVIPCCSGAAVLAVGSP